MKLASEACYDVDVDKTLLGKMLAEILSQVNLNPIKVSQTESVNYKAAVGGVVILGRPGEHRWKVWFEKITPNTGWKLLYSHSPVNTRASAESVPERNSSL